MSSVDYFLLLDGIPGDSTDSHHEHEIDVVAFSWSEHLTVGHTAGGGGGVGVGKVAMGALVVTAPTSRATPKLLVACASGRHIAQATLTCRTHGDHPAEFLVITLKGVLVSSLALAAPSGLPGERPVDEISLAFDDIALSYRAQKRDGSLDAALTGEWNVPTNTGH